KKPSKPSSLIKKSRNFPCEDSFGIFKQSNYEIDSSKKFICTAKFCLFFDMFSCRAIYLVARTQARTNEHTKTPSLKDGVE
ncbi:hypothetical protein ACFQPF_05945, partial [Fictibacillus iocasae]